MIKKLTRKIAHRLGLWLTYDFFLLAGTFCFLYFRIVNRTRIIGKRNIPRQSRLTIIASNHESMHDSWVGGTSAYFPDFLAWPSRAPYHLAAKENFAGNWLIRFILRRFRAIPIDRGKFNRDLLDQIIQLLQNANVWIFYQGTRSYDLTKARNGTAYLIANCQPTPTVIPAYLHGTAKLFGGKPGDHGGLGRWLPRFPGFGRKVTVVFGKSINFEDILENPNDPEIYDKITSRIIEAVKNLQDQAKGTSPILEKTLA